MNLELAAKRVLVTGAASGIGRATALLFAAEGAAVMVADLDESGAGETVAMIEAGGGRAGFVTGDVALRQTARAYVEATVDRFGGLDVLVNDAGVESFAELVDTDDEAWERMFGVNAKGPYMVIQAAARHLRRSPGAAIVNVASAAGLRGHGGLTAYSASKAALILMTRCLAHELGPHDVRANTVCPGFIDTPTSRRWTDMLGGTEAALEAVAGALAIRRPGRPEDVAAMIVTLASPVASYVTGAVVPVDGGMSA